MKILSVLLFTIPMVTSDAQAQFAGGSGNEADPYEVATLEQMQLIADTLYLDKHFVQTADIDASETVDWNDGKGFEPIGRMGCHGDGISHIPFTGSYDGNGFKIENLTINRENECGVGLFGYTIVASIQNVKLMGVKVNGSEYVGGLVAMISAEWNNYIPGDPLGVISYSSVSGSVSGVYAIGGLAGFNGGEIKNSSASVEVSAEQIYVDGHYLGGTSAGGLAGLHAGIVYASFSEGNVTGLSYIGGLVGFIDTDRRLPRKGIVSQSFATGNVSGENHIGGLVGYADLRLGGEVTYSFATGKVSGEGDRSGGLIGTNSNSSNPVDKLYWDKEHSGLGVGIRDERTYNEIFGLSTKQMTGQNAWIFMHKLDFENTWQLTGGYPALRWLEPADSVEVPEAAIITVSERELDFGIVATGDTATHEFMIVNKGNTTLQAEIALPVPTEGHDMVFSIIAGEGTYQLEPGSTHSVEIGFNPKAVRDYTELMLIMHDAQNEDAVLEIQLAGSGKEDTSAEEEKAHKPDRVLLHQNYPNPFNPSTRIRYSLPKPAHVTVEVYDITGRHVETLVDRPMPAGEHATDFDAGGLSSGIYVYRISTSGQTLTRRMTLIR